MADNNAVSASSSTVKNDPTQQPEEDQSTTEAKKEDAVSTINITVLTPSQEKIELQVTQSDSIQDVRQYLVETPQTCYITSYHLEHNTSTGSLPLSDFLEFSEAPDIKDGAVLSIVYDDYNETSARNHLRRLRDILNMTPAALKKDSASFFTEFSKQQSTTQEPNGEKPLPTDPLSLTDYYPHQCNPLVKCLKKLVYSGWNPPPANRRLQGDLFYLEVVTLEGNTHTITVSPQRIFQNATKQGGAFNPLPTEFSGSTLVDLLRLLSPKFKIAFGEIVKNNFSSAHPFEFIPVPYPVKPWLSKLELHSYDSTRAEEELLTTVEVDYHIQGQLRDWNVELQICREQPKETVQDRISRDRAMYKMHTEFVQAAINGATQIVNGNVPSINPTDDPRTHLYIYNNIFYSYALDSRDFYKDMGGDATAYKQASNDLLGVIAYNRADIKGLYTLGTVLIDFRGYRLVAQTIIPGLFSSLVQEGATVNIGYGSLEGKNNFKCHDDFHQLMLEAASKLFSKPHIVIGEDQSSAELAAHADIKGIIGSDQRKYILDLVRVTPRDCNYLDPTDIGALLRSELLVRYILVNEQARIQKLDLVRNKEENKSQEDEEKLSEELMKELEDTAFTLQVNTDIFTSTHLGGSEEEIEEDEAVVRKLGHYLKSDVIPGLVEDLSLHIVNPVDSYTLTNLFHSRGINMRYLGTVAKLLQQKQGRGLSFSLNVIHREMIVRRMKRIFSDFLKKTKSYNIATVVSQILNAFFGRLATTEKGSKSGINSSASTLNYSECTGLSHHDLWAEIRRRVLSKYAYGLPEIISTAIFSVPTLRAICLRMGIQLALKNYNLNSETPFQVGDVVSLYPVAKSSQPESVDGKELVEAAKVYSSQGRTDIAYELLSEALVIFHNVYGPMHEQTGKCYSSLARILQRSDPQAAIQHQEKAIIIYERVCGLDHYETAHAYGFLGSFHGLSLITTGGGGSSGNANSNSTVTALNHLLRSLFLLNVASDPENIDHIDGYTHLGLALQESEPKDSIQYLEKALSLAETIYGSHFLTARLCNDLARVYFVVNDFRTALKYESRNYEVCCRAFGEKDKRTIESSLFLKQLTQKAVQREKQQRNIPHSKQRLEFKTQKADWMSSNATTAANPLRTNANELGSGPAAAAAGYLSSLPIDDLLKIIQSERNTRTTTGSSIYSSGSGKHKKPVSSAAGLQGQMRKLGSSVPTTASPAAVAASPAAVTSSPAPVDAGVVNQSQLKAKAKDTNAKSNATFPKSDQKPASNKQPSPTVVTPATPVVPSVPTSAEDTHAVSSDVPNKQESANPVHDETSSVQAVGENKASPPPENLQNTTPSTPSSSASSTATAPISSKAPTAAGTSNTKPPVKNVSSPPNQNSNRGRRNKGKKK